MCQLVKRFATTKSAVIPISQNHFRNAKPHTKTPETKQRSNSQETPAKEATLGLLYPVVASAAADPRDF
jgi:hypothetical protein